MIAEYLLPAAQHLWQSTLFAAAAGLLNLTLRKNRAVTRYWLWLAASIKFLVPFSILMWPGHYLSWRTTPADVGASWLAAAEQISMPFPAAAPIAPARLPMVLAILWSCGFAAVAVAWFRRWSLVRAAVRHAGSGRSIEPGVFGVFRPILVLPDGIADRLTGAQFQAIVAHEMCHMRRRDNLWSAVHMLVEAIFWFHPLVLWIGARMVEERERACDEDVLQSGFDPQVYAEGILRICELYVASPMEFVAGVSGPNLKKRIEDIMTNREVKALGLGKSLFLTAVGVTALIVPIAAGAQNVPPAPQAPAAPRPPAPSAAPAAPRPPAAPAAPAPPAAPRPPAPPAPLDPDQAATDQDGGARSLNDALRDLNRMRAEFEKSIVPQQIEIQRMQAELSAKQAKLQAAAAKLREMEAAVRRAQAKIRALDEIASPPPDDK